jgi:hypothetical protein
MILLLQASRIPDPKNMTPKRWVELRRPYCITIDTSEGDARRWKVNQAVRARQADVGDEPTVWPDARGMVVIKNCGDRQATGLPPRQISGRRLKLTPKDLNLD